MDGPHDEERPKKIQGLLRYQFDLEILHKWREVQVLEEEIKRGKKLRLLVEKLIMNGIGLFHFYTEP